MKLNMGCGNGVRTGWVNADGFLERPDVVKADLINDWPWPDNTFDEVYMSHVLEHVPFIYYDHNGTQRDVIFKIMEEIHRVLRPEGVFHFKVPMAGSYAADCHPQHYRRITPAWVNYFTPDYPETYYSTARFRQVKWRRNRHDLPLQFAFPIRNLGLISHLADRIPGFRWAVQRRNELEAWWIKA